MRSLSECQWERYFELLEKLEQLPAGPYRYAMLDQYAAKETADVVSLLRLRFSLKPETDRCRSGEQVRNFVLGEQIGRGGMGVVYRAVQEFSDGIERPVAIKLIHPELVAFAKDEAKERFQQEIAILIQLEHKGIARIYDGGRYQHHANGEETLFFAMELVTGKSLNDYVAEHRASLGIVGILRLFSQVCDALSYAHQQGVIHCDLKPDNILVGADAEPRLIDFGLAQIYGKAVCHTAVRLSGTPGYMSPEQISSGLGPVTVASDIYALGVILYELLMGQHPGKQLNHFSATATSTAIFNALLLRFSRLGAGHISALARLIATAMAYQPSDRYPTIASMRRALLRCIDDIQQQQQRSLACRKLLMKKVTAFWIDGVLKNSLHAMALLELGLTLRPDAIEQPWKLIVQEHQPIPQTVPAGTSISEVFRDLDETLLILGAPGAGKTTLLLALTQELLDQAQLDDTRRVPVVFHLSTWAEQRLPLVEWLIGELEKRYQLPPRAAHQCFISNQLIPLLDGLDEVAPAQREHCVSAINDFRRNYGATPIVVCSRITDYEALSARLQLAGAVVIQPLTRQNIINYLEHAGASLAAVRTALRHDEQLWDLLQTPLLLRIAVMVYQQYPSAVVQPAASFAARRTQLLAAYTEVVFKRRGKTAHYTHAQTMHWLAWLAFSMLQRHQSVFYLEWMQPDWLLSPRQRWMASVGSVVLCGLPLGIIAGFSNGLGSNSAFDILILLTVSLGGSLVIGQCGYGDRIAPVTRLRWSWAALREGIRRKLALAATSGVLVAVGIALIFDLSMGIALGAATMAVLGYFGGIDLDLKTTDLDYLTVPNGAMRQSLFNTLTAAAAGTVVGAFMGGVASGWSGAWLGAAFLGLVCALTFGGHPCLQHLILRWFLWRNGNAPFHYVHFLDFAVERILLYRVGGGYAFIHRTLLEYFASKYSAAAKNQTNG